MPIEIRELIIRATIAQDDKGGGPERPPSEGNNNDVSANEQLINDCVEQILEILKEKHGR